MKRQHLEHLDNDTIRQIMLTSSSDVSKLPEFILKYLNMDENPNGIATRLARVHRLLDGVVVSRFLFKAEAVVTIHETEIKLDKDRMLLALRFLTLALSEPDEMKRRWRTDAIGIALQFAGKYRPKFKREDFKIIQDKTIDELIEILTSR